MSYLQEIKRFRGDNMGGVVALYVARKADIISIPEPVGGIIYGDIEFRSGASFVPWRFTLTSAAIRSTNSFSREGPIKNNVFPLRIPKDRPNVRQILETAEIDELIVLFRYANDKQKLFGLLDAPVRFEFDHSSGANFSDGNFYEGRFIFSGPDNTNFYEGTIAVAPPGAAPVLVKVNGVVVASLAPGETINFDSDFDFDFYIVGT